MEETNPNDIWSHVTPLNKDKDEKKAELQFMRDLFDFSLPLGDNREAIDNYFNELEKVISTKDGHKQIQPEGFSEQPGGSDGSLDSTGVDAKREYWYYSSSFFKQRASSDLSNRDGKNLGYTGAGDEFNFSAPTEPKSSDGTERIPECADDFEVGVLECDKDSDRDD